MTTSRRPYLIRALYDWCIDNKLTPHIVVDTSHGGCEVPEEFVNEDGKIILNIGEKATWDLYIDDFNVGFGARFKGEPHKIKVSTNAVVGIYDKETGAGMVFGEALPPEEPEPESKTEKKIPHLRLVVNNDES